MAACRLTEGRLEQVAGQADRTAAHLLALRRVANASGSAPTVAVYRDYWHKSRGDDEALPSVSALIKHFGSWRQAREALELSKTSSARQIEARFARRRLGKIWRYTEETLQRTLAACVRDVGHVPQVAEFEHWRRRELEVARAKGDDALHLPSSGPYRRRYGSWEKALLALGYTPDQVVERLDRSKGAHATGAGLK